MLYLTILNYCLDFSYCIISIYFFLLNILGCALICASSKDPLFVLLHFLGIFILSIYTLFFLNIEFLGFVFLLVYLGAIMIFFMFVINFINLRYKISVFTYVERGKLLVWEIFTFFILVNLFITYFLGFSLQIKYHFNYLFLFKLTILGKVNNFTNLILDDFYKLIVSKSMLEMESVLTYLNLYNTHFFLLLLLALILFIVLVGSIFICEIDKHTKLKNFILR